MEIDKIKCISATTNTKIPLLGGIDIKNRFETPISLYDSLRNLIGENLIGEIESTDNYNVPERYIINKGATILFWNDGTKTIVKRHNEDEYDIIKGFLWAYFEKNSGMSKTKANKYLKSLEEAIDDKERNISKD